MRILRYEWKKLCGFRLLWLLLAVLLCINGYVQISAANERGYSPKEYRSALHYVQKLKPERRMPYLEKQMNAPFAGERGVYEIWCMRSCMTASAG